MKHPLSLALSATALALLLYAPHNARAQAGTATGADVTLIAPGGIQAAVQQLIPAFEHKTGKKVNPTFGSGLGTKKQVASGKAFDVPILQPPYPEVLASGNVIAASAKPLASVAVGVAVRKGAPKPDISSPAAVKKTLLAAKSVAFPNSAGGAAAGISFEGTLKQLGIWDQMQATLKRAQGGAAAMKMTASGEAAIGITFLSEMNEPGLDIVGPLPKEISTPTNLVGFISTHAKNPAVAKLLLDFLASPEAAPAYKAQLMQPPTP